MIESLNEQLTPIKEQLVQHPLYKNIGSTDDIRQFMKSHVYAVWDFMSLVKKLQLDLTTTSLPWQPPSNNSAARLINEIVWGEETDVDKDGNSVSHFEMYLNAMHQIGADTTGIEGMLLEVQQGNNIFDIIDQAGLPTYVADFLRFTFHIIEEDKIHKIAAVFTFGREDLIPDMFISMIKKMNRDNDQDFDQIIYYFERHIEVDGDSHGPMALQMIKNLCGTDPIKWEEAISASKSALERRIALWDGINLQITQKEKALS
ncbi:MAG: DUF3050 domain-containing protein [Flavobacteriaceae bacterium]|jgi:hypothetical protein|nr:DUF3050 domain-containing protein [Flavobacteriaceae bacterium]